MAIVNGTDNSETLDTSNGVTYGADEIHGLGGHDTIYGFGGDDAIFAGDGNDTVRGGRGDNTMYGGFGSDTVIYDDAFSGVEVYLDSGYAIGEAQADIINGFENAWGSNYDDRLLGDDNANVLSGLGGADLLVGFEGADTLNGGTNHDTLSGHLGADTLNGGDGNDTATYVDSDVGVEVSILHDTAAFGHAQGDELNSIENLTGSAHNDKLSGKNGVNVLKGENGKDELKGFGGDDTLYGGNHNDTLHGGPGNDTMYGGLGSDLIFVDSAGDVVVEAANEGNDIVKTTVSYQLAADASVETLRTGGDAGTTDIDLTGNSHINRLIGNAGDNILDGKGGVDQMLGLVGDDTYFVNHALDDVFELAGQGGDTVRATVNYQLDAGLQIEALTTIDNNGVGAINLTGNNVAQVIVGNAGANILHGGGGDDYLQGRDGNDTLIGGAGADKFLFNTTLNAVTNVDIIADMTAGVDVIRLDDAVFTGIGAVGVLNADAFHIGPAAADAEDRVIYESETGDLYYDSNGIGAGGQTLFAKLDPGLALTNTDFAVV